MTVWRLRLDHRGDRSPILVEADPSTPRGVLVERLSTVGVGAHQVWVDGARWSTTDAEPIGSSSLHHGSLIAESDTVGPAAPTGAEPGHHLVVIAGPAAGRSVALVAGSPVTVGRTSGDLVVDDALLSSAHFSVEFVGHDGAVRITDLGSTNGTYHEGAEIESATISRGSVVQAGMSLFVARSVTDDELANLLGESATGRTVQRQFREALPALAAAPKPPSRPNRPGGEGGTTWWRSLMPLVTAVGFAVMFGRWEFLVIAAFAPIIYTIDNQRRRRTTKRQRTTDAARYAADTARYRAEIVRLREAEARRARRAGLGGGSAAQLARCRHRTIWERRPTDADFCSVTLGFAALPSIYPLEAPHVGDNGPDGRADHSANAAGDRLWQVPLAVDLRAEGPLGVIGPAGRTAAVLRSLLIDLAVAHAPVDVRVWVLAADDRRDDWMFAQWLPHTFVDGGGSQVGVTPLGRTAIVTALTGLVETRLDAIGTHEQVLPVHVVVVDGIDGVPSHDLARILRRGPDVGVIGIVADEQHLAEGIRGEVRLGEFDDECSFRSVRTPRTHPVTVAQVARDVADDAALALSGIEAIGGGVRAVEQVFFTELAALPLGDAAAQRELWRRHSPRTDVPVGVTMDGEPFHVDIVRHGPHGLIGGMTRSGKTEFLKTWFSSLATYNHPDDLAIAIVDFKGGVDHQLTARLPHVVTLTTNQSIDLFERTITLLSAEHERRERIFHDEAGVATIEGYRTARESRPELPPIPRLIVVVDEFAELLETPEGKAQIGKLESFSRIGAGLGVHLLLLTQLFNQALPPTIDGQAGLRVCFKVQNAADSKVVLKSGVAAELSSATKGRAYARFQGGDVVEFQSARVGNEARHRPIGAGAASKVQQIDVAVHYVTPESMTVPPPAAEHREVPNEHQDLHHVVETIRAAAALDGFTTSAMPWPAELPDAIELADLPASHDERAVIGLADDPAAQRTVPVVHSCDAVVAYAGAAHAGHHRALVTTALASALTTAPDDLHLYGIDLVGQGLAQLAPLPHAGTIATRDDTTSLRILDWLVTEAATRRAAIARCGVADHAAYVLSGGTDLPTVTLYVTGVDRMFLHGEGASSPLLAPMTTLVNEVAGTGIQIVMSGTHAMLANRVGSSASRRLIFAANDTADYPPVVGRATRAMLAAPMRCYDTRTGLVSQIAEITTDPTVNVRDVVAAIAAGVAGYARRVPVRFTSAPWPLTLDDLDADARPDAGLAAPLPFGVRPDSGAPVWLDPIEDGNAFRIVGPPKSGRSNALAAVGVMAERAGWSVVAAAGSRRSPLVSDVRRSRWTVSPEALVQRVSDGVRGPTVVLVDDAHRLAEDFPWEKLVNCDGGPLVLVLAGATDALTRTTGPMRALGAVNGVALAPARSRDAAGLNVAAIDDQWLVNPRAGVGVLGLAGEAHRVQFPLVVG